MYCNSNSMCVSRKMPGCPCQTASECTTGAFEDAQCTNNMCALSLYHGMPCSLNSQCASGNCSSSMCLGMTNSMACTHTYGCQPGYFCSATNAFSGSHAGFCKPVIRTGMNCTTSDFLSDGCEGGSVCDLDPTFTLGGVCRKVLSGGSGSTCSGGLLSATVCRFGYACRGGACVSSTSSCDFSNNQCPMGQTCDCSGTSLKCAGTARTLNVACQGQLDTMFNCFTANNISFFQQTRFEPNYPGLVGCLPQILAYACSSACAESFDVGPRVVCSAGIPPPYVQTRRCNCTSSAVRSAAVGIFTGFLFALTLLLS